MIKHRASAYLLAFLLVQSGIGFAAIFNVGAGSRVSLGEARIDLGCDDLLIRGQLNLDQGTLKQVNDLVNAGTLNGGQALLELSGDWRNNGIFNPGTGTVRFSDGCNNASADILGSSNFNNLAIVTTSGKQINFAAGATQSVASNLTLTGQAGNLLVIRSTVPGSPAFLCLAPGGSQTISYVDVRDNRVPSSLCQPLASGAAGNFNSVDSGNSPGWFLNAIIDAIPIPTLSVWGMAMLIMMLLAWGGRRLRAIPSSAG